MATDCATSPVLHAQMSGVPQFRRGIALYDYQIDAIEQIIAAEKKCCFEKLRGHIPLTEPFGSGKTFIVLGLIMKNPLPSIRPVFLYDNASHDSYASFTPDKTNQVIRPTAIVVARSVYAQWIHNLKTYTSLRFFEARDKIAIGHLVDMIANGDINDYDVVLVKYGQTNDVDGTKCELCKIINRKTIPMVWGRVVYDDVDLISESICMRAISSIFVTGATDFTFGRNMRLHKRGSQIHGWQYPLVHFDAKDLLVNLPQVNHIFTMAEQGGSGAIWATLGHCPESIARDHGIYAMQWLDCSIVNDDIERATHLISGIESPCTTELLTMINSDAMISAARLLNISVVTPNAMFASVLGTQREDYETAQSRIAVLGKIRAVPFAERCADGTPDQFPRKIVGEDGATHVETVAEKQNRIMMQADITDNMCASAEKNIKAIADSFRVRALLSVTDLNIAPMVTTLENYIHHLDRSFTRIRENLTDQTCQICCGPLTSEHVTIMRCCGLIICASCCSRSCRFSKDGDKVIGICAQCRQPLDIAHDIIFVESGIDIDNLIQKALNDPNHGMLSPVGESDVAMTQIDSETVPIKTKTAYIVALIHGDIMRAKEASAGFSGDVGTSRAHSECLGTLIAPNETRVISNTLSIHHGTVPEIRGVMNGTQVVPAKEKMFLVCVSFDETINDISCALSENEIPHAVLHGSVYEFAEVIDKYMRGVVHVLIINTRALFAGVDLQSTTDIIIVDPTRTDNIGQIIGRAQRLGRSSSLTIHSLSYVGEKDALRAHAISAPRKMVRRCRRNGSSR